MQTSTIMLDSTLDKILTTRQVEDRLTQNDVDNSQKEDEDSEGNQSTKSEAEVRLVVRFIVEEQIVFKGKIERVNQLESEELSRVVSRVAWDDANDSSKSTTDSENGLAQEKANVKSDDKSLQSKSQAQTSSSTSSSSAIALNEPTENSSAPSGDQHADQVQERPTSNNDSSDHLACIEPCPQSSELTDGCEDSVAQVKRHPTPEKSETKNHCDNNSERPQNHICETDHQYLQIPPLIQELTKQDSKECKDTGMNIEVNQPNQIYDTQTNDALTESQSVAEALNECVNSVDREIRVSECNFLSKPGIQYDGSKNSSSMPKQYTALEVNGISEDSKICLKTTLREVDTKSKDMIVDISTVCENKKSLDLVKDNPIENKDQLKQSRDHKYITTKEPALKVELVGPSSGKRKIAGEHASTGKRIRRIVSKDQRNQNTRTSGNRVTENLSAQQTVLPNKIDTASLLATNQQTRQKKVFAKWSDNHFYPGTILRLTRDRKFLIGFFDGAQRSVAETDIIPLCNIEGKQVRMSIAKNYCVNAIVHNEMSPVNDQPMFDVEYQQEGSVRKCVPLKDIFLTGEQGTPLISQPDKNSGGANFADVDLDNIIYEKRSRRFQEMEDFELTENTSSGNKRKRGQYNIRNTTPRAKPTIMNSNSPILIQKKSSQDEGIPDSESVGSPDNLKANFLCPNSNPPSESSSSTGSSNVPNVLELNQEFYFSSSSPHHTKTSLLL